MSVEHTLRTFNLLYLSTGLGNFGKIYYFETYGSKKTHILAYFAHCMGNMWKCMLQLNQIHAAVQSLSARTIFQIFRFYCCDHDNSISILTWTTLNGEMGRRGLSCQICDCSQLLLLFIYKKQPPEMSYKKRCFLVIFPEFSRTPFTQNTSRWLLLVYI